jgi:ABC-2 type transport system ATP-binding protein
MTHGYGGWHRGDFGFQQALASAGYIVLGYTSRGFGRSGGQVQLDSPDYEVQDATFLISWLAAHASPSAAPVVPVLLDGTGDPRAGMVGGSYAGGIQLLTASYDQRLDAITPQITWHDLRYSLAPNGVVKHGWIDLLYPSGKYSGMFGPLPPPGNRPPVVSTDGVPVDQDLQIATSYLANDSVDLPVAYTDGSTCTNTYCYLKYRSPTYDNVIDDIRAATFLIQGQRDRLFWVNEAVANMAAIADNGPNGVPTKLMVFSAGHGYGDLGGERAEINTRIFAWFDCYLKQIFCDTGPAVEVWRPWAAPQPSYGALAAFPEAVTPTILSSTTATLVNLVAPTSHSEVWNFQQNPPQGSYPTPPPSLDLAPGATAQDLTATLPAGADTIAGIPLLRFQITATAPEAIVFAKLWDADAAGTRTLIHHAVTPARIRQGKGDFCAPDATPGAAAATPVSSVDVCLPLSGIVWRVEAGHSLVLTLATSDTEFFASRFPGVYSISNISLDVPTTTEL